MSGYDIRDLTPAQRGAEGRFVVVNAEGRVQASFPYGSHTDTKEVAQAYALRLRNNLNTMVE